MASLRLRILIFVSLLLVVFFGLAIVVLDAAFRDAAMRGEQERLDIQLIALLAAAEPGEADELRFPATLQDPRFDAPGSGLYAAVFDHRGEQVWHSRSTLGLVVPWVNSIETGTRRFEPIQTDAGTELLSYSLGVDWQFDDDRTATFSFHVAESLVSFDAQVAGFRRQLFGWFVLVAIGLLVSLALLLGGLLRPLARIEDEIHAVEQGEREQLSAGYPSELSGVARNLNALVRRERSRGEVYRRTLGDLAHSLKTPLASLQSLLGTGASKDVSMQLTRMDELIRYQLAKPATRGRMIGTKPFAVAPELAKLLDSFAKIYHQKSVALQADIPAELSFRGDKGDFMELAGNLIDNAYKRCKNQVQVALGRDGGEFWLRVEDDGPGFPDAATETLTTRGERLDEADSSQGLGLAIVADICELYGADLDLGVSDLGGASVHVRVPNP
ncbi:MAG: ATP-binding protein [Pseudomonadota bacterium]